MAQGLPLVVTREHRLVLEIRYYLDQVTCLVLVTMRPQEICQALETMECLEICLALVNCLAQETCLGLEQVLVFPAECQVLALQMLQDQELVEKDLP